MHCSLLFLFFFLTQASLHEHTHIPTDKPYATTYRIYMVYDNGNTISGYETDSRTSVTSSSNLVTAANGIITASGDPSSGETVTLTFSFSFTSKVVEKTISIYIADALTLDVNPYPSYSSSSSVSVSELKLIHHTNVYQRAQAKLTVSFSLGSVADVFVTNYQVSNYNSSDTSVLTISNQYLVPVSAGTARIQGTFGTWLTSNAYDIVVSASPYALVSSMILSRSSSIVTGIVNSTYDDLNLKVVFDDGSIFDNARDASLDWISVDKYIDFVSSITSEISVDTLGKMTLKGNSEDPM